MTAVPRIARALSRRQWLVAAAALGASGLGLDAFAIEPDHPLLTRHRLGSGGGRPLRLVQLSDLHLRRVGPVEQHIADIVTRLSPDIIAITGDAIDRDQDIDLLDAFLGLLAPSARKLAILGNWERWRIWRFDEFARVYERHGCQLLINQSITLTGPWGGTLLVTGLDDLIAGKPDPFSALRGQEWRRNHLLLAHCPQQRDLLGSPNPEPLADASGRRAVHEVDPRLFRPEVILAGHTHGGQITLLGLAPYRPRGSGPYLRGWYRDRATSMYVSRGIGTTTIPARLGAPPEIAYFEWNLS